MEYEKNFRLKCEAAIDMTDHILGSMDQIIYFLFLWRLLNK